MSLKAVGTIAIPHAQGSAFDHAAFDPKTRRIFIAHTARDCIDVVDHDAARHIATLPGFPGVAGAVVDDGQVLATNRGSASVALFDGATYETKAEFRSGRRPNGAAILVRAGVGIAACIGDDNEGPTLHLYKLANGHHVSIGLPGRPRWCVTDAAGERLFLAIRDPSMLLVASIPDLKAIARWPLPAAGAHGLDIDHQAGRLYVACDDATVVEVDSGSGKVCNSWSIGGPPDVTFFNPATGLVHVAIGEPGLVETIDPKKSGTTRLETGAGAHTTAIAAPDRLYVISPAHGGLLVLADT